MLKNLLLVGIGGGAGSALRYVVGLLVNKYWAHPYPLATFLINITGCFIIGTLAGLMQRYNQQGWWLLLATGFCGGFTTFSSFALENNVLMDKQLSVLALLYIAASIVVGLLLCKAGIVAVRN